LSIRSSASPAAANIALTAGGTQSITYVDVQDSNASGGLQLVARLAPDHSAGGFNNTNWAFGSTTITWDGSTSTDWDTQSNWDKGLVPVSSDIAIIANAGNQPATLATDVTLTGLTINSNATVSLVGHSMTVSGALTNNGALTRYGN